MVWPQRAPLLSLRSDWHAVDDAQQASARLERRLEHVGITDVPTVRCEWPVGLNDEPPAALGGHRAARRTMRGCRIVGQHSHIELASSFAMRAADRPSPMTA